MGSCFSKKEQSPASSSSAKRHLPDENPPRRRSPPPLDEEETVKEVLSISETPKNPPPKIHPKPAFPAPETPRASAVKEEVPIPETPKNPIPEIDPKPFYAIHETPKFSFVERQAKRSLPKAQEVEKEEKTPTFISADEASEFSEICSVSETISTATVAEKRDGEENGGEEVEMRPKELASPAKIRRKRSFSGDSAGRIERKAKSPARRSDPSPARRAPAREMGRTNRSRTPTGSTGFRRDTAERRSRSPATRREMGRSPSGRRTDRSPRRRPVEAAEGGGQKVKEGAATAAADAAHPSPKESLENPLVSLECFIFL